MEFIEHMSNFLLENPRAPHMIQKDSLFSKEISSILNRNLNNGGDEQVVKKMGITIKPYDFYEEPQYTKSRTVQVNVITSRLMELYVFLGIFAYLIVLYTLLESLNSKKTPSDKDEAKDKQNR